MQTGKTKVHNMHGHAMYQLRQKYVDLNTRESTTPQQPFDGKARGVLAAMWLTSIVALASVLTPGAALAADGYHLSGELSLNGQRIARPNDYAEDGRESYVIVQSDDYTVRLTYTIQSAGDNLVDARFLIELDQDDGWETLMQPAVQAVLGQQASVAFEAPQGSDEPDVEFVFTIRDQE